MRMHFLQPETKKSPVAWCEKNSAAAEDAKSESKWRKHDHWLSQIHRCCLRFLQTGEPFNRVSGGALNKVYCCYSVWSESYVMAYRELPHYNHVKPAEGGKNTLSNLLALFPWNNSFNTSSFGPAHAVLILFEQCRWDAQYIYFPSN